MLRAFGVAGVVVALGLTALTAAGRQRPSPPASGTLSLPAILAIEDARAPAREDLALLVQALGGNLRIPAIRALGRLQRRDVVTDLLPWLSPPASRSQAATALMLALRGTPPAGFPASQQEQAVLDALVATGGTELARPDPESLDSLSLALGHLRYDRIDTFKAAEAFLRRVLEKPFPKREDLPHAAAARALEALARLNRMTASLDDETVSRLRTLARTIDPKRTAHQRNALAALIAAQSVDEDTLAAALKSHDTDVRRLAMVALTGSGSSIVDDERLRLIRTALGDSSFSVRLEAVRAWMRRGAAEHGCQPLVDALADRSLHVVLAALDALGDVCRDDAAVTDRIVYEARTPAPGSRWQREAHAFVALAKRDRERAAVGLMTFAMHNTWQVRMYAARAAAVLDDVAVLERLAADPDDNVVEVALPPLRRLRGADSDQAFVAALRRVNRTGPSGEPARPYQVIRAAARALDGARPTPEMTAALIGALERISAEDCDTSRDARLALIERLGVLGTAANASSLTPLLKDTDPAVAGAAARLLTTWTGRAIGIDTPGRPVTRVATAAELDERVSATFEMENGGRFAVTFYETTPLTVRRVVEAIRRGYYNRLTFHRVVPNFVIQGGSPNANEYCGACPFMRDEPGALHERGVVGISTRGPDTGDAQIFINLVDNARLDYDYTAFARVCGRGMEVVDGIQEGDRITRVRVDPESADCR